MTTRSTESDGINHDVYSRSGRELISLEPLDGARSMNAEEIMVPANIPLTIALLAFRLLLIVCMGL